MLDQMVEHARREAPDECVGVLGTRDGEPVLLVEAENARHSPLAYEIAPQELLRVHDRLDEDDLEVGAIYHSHTRTEPVPSQTDINLAFYPEALYIIVGLAGAFAMNRLIASLLFGVRPTDPMTLVAVVATITLVAAVACWLPAWRASRLDPNIVLRQE